MESRDLHHNHDLQLFQLDHEVVGSSSSACTTSSLVSSPYLSVGSSSHACWTPNFHLNTSDTSSSIAPLRDLNHQKNDEIQQASPPPPPSLNINNSMYQQSFPRSNGNNVSPFMVVSDSDMNPEQNPVKIKEEDDELSGNSFFTKFTDLLNYSSSNSSSLTTLHEDQQLEHHHHHQHHHKNEEEDDDDEMNNINDLLSEKALLKALSSNFSVSAGSSGGGDGQFHQPNLGTSMPPIRGYFSQIFPSVNISSLNNNNNNHPISCSSSMVEQMNFEALDLLSPATSRFQPNYSHNYSTNTNPNYHDGSSSFVMDQIKQSSNPNYHDDDDDLSSLNNNGVVELAKRHSNAKTNIVVEPRGVHPQPAPSKKPRCEPRASCPPFKVKKEKLGDRIAALQQLVAPFGKTDTASVLMEAIGYIKFLQNQVETLSVPYMRLSAGSGGETTQRVSTTTGECESEEAKLPADLRSRGLCLVPLSCMSHITNDGGGGGRGSGTVWPSLNFNPCGVDHSSMCSYS